ncbi:pyridoxamine 5'-phosphate oxidase family protein [Ideonella sp. BN130291]|uniref:pyridoxamine 5'-phosphate oxidase family protein n=1 Tax=Ideonella sp. BN130291 TaxID=3112940 RepID=UPI002E267CBA|nr:pyridoxamine 5'-phosphate oxidase family protein [Ideonella sp. BN130291]
MPEHLPPSDRTRVRRVPQRGHYDRETVHAIVDAAYLCHVAFTDAHGVHCIPTACWREDDHLYVHGSNGSRMLRALAEGGQACVTITHLDGLVLARSAFHHSMNYRSVVVYGRFDVVPAEHKPASLDRFMDRIAPGRKLQVRPGDASELAATTILRMPLDESSAKVRSGGPKDDEADMAIPVWAGVLPITMGRGTPQPDGDIARETPDYVRGWPCTAA